MLEASPGKPLSRYAQLATLQEMVGEVFDAQDNMQQFLEEQELSLAEDHIAFDAASRIQADKDEARENELLRVQAVRFLEGQERVEERSPPPTVSSVWVVAVSGARPVWTVVSAARRVWLRRALLVARVSNDFRAAVSACL